LYNSGSWNILFSTIKVIDNSFSCLERLFSLFPFLIPVQATCRPHRFSLDPTVGNSHHLSFPHFFLIHIRR
ncbi:MAG: hypothetical protein AAGE84_02745, partial [Cyanobacteria bacterium P01_G01_bin.39]